MIAHKLQTAWKALRANYWGSLAFDVTVILMAFALLQAWQTRNLPDDEHTPPLELAWLDDKQADSVMVPGETGVIYFFAPWCFYCKHSIGNLNKLVASGKLSWARTVALDYRNLDEVREFIRETNINLPVLLGNQQTFQDWQIRAFPTYFVINGKGQITSRSVGYSTSIGLQSRVWLNSE